MGRAWFRVAVLDLNSRIDLTASDERVLGAFFGVSSVSLGAPNFLDALQDRKDEDDSQRLNGAEAEDYRAAGSAFVRWSVICW